VQKQLADAGWRVMIIWECAIRGPGQLGVHRVTQRIAAWLPTLSNLRLVLRASKREAA
jgi:DNA mismatch endonuclease (patch repair protein)